jgi:hypothetical protein
MERRKQQYKQQGGKNGKEKRRQLDSSIRKERRGKAVSAKRRIPCSKHEVLQSSPAQIAAELAKLSVANPTEQLEALRNLRRMLSSDEPPIQAFVDGGAVPLVVHLLETSAGDCQIEAAWCLAQVCTGNTEQIMKVAVGIPLLIQLLSAQEGMLVEKAVFAIANVASDCDQLRQALREEGAIPPMVKLLSPQTPANIVQTASWGLSNLLRGAGAAAGPMVEAGVFTSWMQQLQQVPTQPGAGVQLDTVAELLWLMTYLTSREDAVVEYMLQQGLLPVLTRWIEAATSAHAQITQTEVPALQQHHFISLMGLLVPLLRCVGNLSGGANPGWTDLLLQQPLQQPAEQHGSFSHCMAHILSTHREAIHGSAGVHSYSERAVLKEALWALSNVLGGTPSQSTEMLRQCAAAHSSSAAGSSAPSPLVLVQLLVAVVHTSQYDVQREAAFAIYNLSDPPLDPPLSDGAGASSGGGGDPQHTQILNELVARGMVGPALEMVSAQSADMELVAKSLFFVETILRMATDEAFSGVRVVEECGGIDHLEQLQYSTAVGGSAEVRRMPCGLCESCAWTGRGARHSCFVNHVHGRGEGPGTRAS